MNINKLSKYVMLPTAALGIGLGVTRALQYEEPNHLSNHPFLKELKEKMEGYAEKLGAEKTYVQFDKSFYKPGETVWFAAYIRDARTLQAAQSRIVYVELINPKGAVEKKLTLLTQDGQGAGEFELAQSVKGGIYKIKAYTLLQNSTQTIFEREITVQAVVLPNLNMKLDFERKGYGEGDKVTAFVDLANLDKTPLANYEFEYVVSLGGDKVETKKGKTDAQGRAYIEYGLPKKLASNDGLLNVMLQYKGQTESISRSIPIQLGDIDLQFFPEGGDMVAGTTNNVAFKALDEFGKPTDIEGKILNKKGEIVATFKSYHQGMGTLALTPNGEEIYTAEITSPVSLKTKYALPMAKANAYTLQVSKQDKTNIVVDAISPNAEEIYLIAQNNGTVVYSEAIQAKKGKNTVSIPTGDFPVGITQISLFDGNKAARAERLVFTNPHKQLKVSVKTDQDKYQPREKVKMTVEVKDENGRPVEGNFSVSVADDKLLTFADDKQGHILSSILLESELKGEIEEPNFYFDSESDPTRKKPEISRARALDHLLLTQGWRRFTWKQVQDNQLPALAAAEKGIASGYARDGQGLAVVGCELVAYHPTLGSYRATTDKNGAFVFDNLPLYEAFTIKTADSTLISSGTQINDFNNIHNVAIYKRRHIRGVVKDPQGNILKGIQVYNATKGAYIATDERGEFVLDLYDMPNHHYVYIYDPAYKWGPKNVNVAQHDSDKRLVVQLVAYQRPTPKYYSGGGRGKGSYKSSSRSKSLESAPKGNSRRESIEEVDYAIELDDVQLTRSTNISSRSANEALARNSGISQKDIGEAVNTNGSRPVNTTETFISTGKVSAPPVEEKKPVDNKIKDEEELEEAKLGLAADTMYKSANKLRDEKAPVIVVAATRFHRAREFYAPKYEQAADEKTVRNDFRSTIYWNARLRTNAKGIAEVEFYNSDDLSQFRISVEGFGKNGGVGRGEYKFFTQRAFEMVAKVPTEVLTADILRIPVALTNNTTKELKGRLIVELPKHLKWVKEPQADIALAPKASTTVYLECEALHEPASGDFLVLFKSDVAADRMLTTVQSRPRGFPVRQVFAGDKLSQSFEVAPIEPIKGSVEVKLNVYPSVLDEILKGMESMLRMPGGCFEQTSSSNYPNVLVLSYMREAGTTDKALEDRVKGFLDVGYGRLSGFECKQGGFDWYGRDPGHEGLTAYGIIQFTDMKNVYKVDEKIIERTSKWLISRRDGKGSWQVNPSHGHYWGKSEPTEAYITWALTEAKMGDQIKQEIDATVANADKSQDPYVMALAANALYNVGDIKRAEKMMEALVKKQTNSGSFDGKTNSITYSTGKALTVETTALATLALLKSQKYLSETKKAVDFLKTCKDYYGYGSTQGTILTLKAFIAHAKANKRTAEDGILVVAVDGKEVARVAYKAGDKQISVPALSPYIKTGKNKVEVYYEGTKNPIPFDITFTYSTRLPQSSKDCALSLSTTLAEKQIKMGETVRLSAELRNTTNQSVSMAIAQIGIPAGLSVQHWQLKEMQDKRMFDFYEIFEGYVVLHFERLRANELKSISFDLKADIPGSYEAPASVAYLYYTHEHRNWVAPNSLVIQ